MAGSKSPLVGNLDWIHRGLSTGLRAPVARVISSSKKVRVEVSASSSCRETIINHLRRNLLGGFYSAKESRYGGTPLYEPKPGKASLDEYNHRQPGETYLQVSRHVLLEPARVKQWLKVMDAVAGPIGVLMSPNRFVGNWWDTNLEEATQGDKLWVKWYGIDNSVLHHPALVSLFLGLARQCVWLVRADQTSNVLEAVSRKEVRRALTNSDPDLALEIACKLRPWIEVPPPRYAGNTSIPVHKGEFGTRIVSLHKALYRHGFDDSFGGTFHNRWALPTNGGSSIGPYGFNGRGINHTFSGPRGRTLRDKLAELAK